MLNNQKGFSYDISSCCYNTFTKLLRNNIKALIEIYQKRWTVKEFHKSLKQNLNIEQSPTKPQQLN